MNVLNDIMLNRIKDLQKPSNLGRDYSLPKNKTTSVSKLNYSIEEKVIENKAGVNFTELAKKRYSNHSLVIVNNSEYMVNGELVLPEAITSLIDNPMYIPRYKKLAKIHGVDYLIKLAELARLKNHYKPNRWFAKCCGVEEWQEKTLGMLNKLFKKIHTIREKLKGININESYLYYYTKASDKLTENQLNKVVESAKKRWVDKPPNMLAKATKQALSGKAW